jgi:hypothetical protein
MNMSRDAGHIESYKDPSIFENPIEASIELADLAEQKVPSLKTRNDSLAQFSVIWTIVMMGLTVLTGYLVFSLFILQNLSNIWIDLFIVAFGVILLPSIGLGIALVVMAFQERMFLPYLEQTSKAVVALESLGRHGHHADKGEEEGPPKEDLGEARRLPGGSLGGILGSAMWVGDLVPVAGRLLSVARTVVGTIIASLVYLVALAVVGVLSGTYIIGWLVAEIIVFAIFVGPAMLLYVTLSRDMEFYQYYSRRHAALAEMASVGIPPVPEGKDHLERYMKFLKGLPAVKALLSSPEGGVEKEPGRKGYAFSRLVRGTVGKEHKGIVVKVYDKLPDREELGLLVEEARAFGQRRGMAVRVAVALVAADVDDLSDRVYEHLIEEGKRTRVGDVALQLVMEVEGTYSMVPYVALGR